MGWDMYEVFKDMVFKDFVINIDKIIIFSNTYGKDVLRGLY